MRLITTIIVFIFTALPLVLSAQLYTYTSDQFDIVAPSQAFSSFSVKEKKGCTPFIVDVSTDYCTAGGRLTAVETNGQIIDIPSPTSTTQITFKEPGTHDLTFRCNGNVGTPAFDKLTVTVFDNPAPAFDIFSCQNAVYLQVTDTHNFDGDYTITYPGPITKSKPAGGIDKQTLAGLNIVIKVKGIHLGAADNCKDSSQSINIVPFITPNIDTLKIISATEIVLKYTEQKFVPYTIELERFDPTAKPFVPFANSVTNTNGFFKVQNAVVKPDVGTNYYCFKITPEDKCTNTVQASSPTMCSINLHATPVNNEIDLTWETSSPGVGTFSLIRDNGAPIIIPNNPFSYADITTICNTSYAYKLKRSTTGMSVSMTRSPVTAFSTDKPPALSYIGSEVNDNGQGVVLTWAAGVNPKEYNVINSIGPTIGTSATPTYTDDGYATGTCYQIEVRNLCDNTSINNPAYCPINLVGTVNKDNSVTLTWSSYAGILTYTLEKIDGTGAVQTITGLGTTYTDPAPAAGDPQEYIYRIVAEGAPLQTSSNTYTAVRQPNIFYPTAFTPNGDATNDTFLVIGQFVSGFEMRIFNRWGEEMFSTTDINQGWDGKYHGLSMPEGTYVFTATLTDEIGRKFKRSGSVVLLHKR